MARPAVLFYKKVTFSLPRKVVEILELKADPRKRSQFVAEAIQEKAEEEEKEADLSSFFRDFQKKYKPLPGPSSLELLRKARYEDR